MIRPLYLVTTTSLSMPTSPGAKGHKGRVQRNKSNEKQTVEFNKAKTVLAAENVSGYFLLGSKLPLSLGAKLGTSIYFSNRLYHLNFTIMISFQNSAALTRRDPGYHQLDLHHHRRFRFLRRRISSHPIEVLKDDTNYQ
jgi:hypothetical protein